MSKEDEYISEEEYNKYIKEVRQLVEKLKELPPTDITVVSNKEKFSVSIEGTNGVVKSVCDWIEINKQVMEGLCSKVKSEEEAIEIAGLIAVQIDDLINIKANLPKE